MAYHSDTFFMAKGKICKFDVIYPGAWPLAQYMNIPT